MFNSLRYTKALEEAGVARNQAEAHVGIMADMMGSHFATTQDMKDLRVELTQDMEKLRTDLRQDFYKVSQDLVAIHNKMDNLEYRLTIKLGGLLAGSIALAATVMTLIIKLV